MADVSFGAQLDHPPSDGVTSLRFSPSSDLLLASSWDGTARLYDGARNLLRGSYSHGAPVLDATFQEESAVFTGGLDKAVKRYDFFSRSETTLGYHSQPVKCVEYIRERKLLVSGSWDKTLQLWDVRSAPGANSVACLQLSGKVYSMSQSGSRLVVGTSDRRVLVYDLRSLEKGVIEQNRESSLRYQTRCLRCYPDGTGFALGSVEGRVAMEYFDMGEESQAKKYAFKCHRLSDDNGKNTIYPVNALAFNPVYGTFATGGGDGVVNVWDGQNKKRLAQILKYPTSVAALAFNPDGSLLAVASSYTFEAGDKEHPRDAIYVRRMAEMEVKPKSRK